MVKPWKEFPRMAEHAITTSPGYASDPVRIRPALVFLACFVGTLIVLGAILWLWAPAGSATGIVSQPTGDLPQALQPSPGHSGTAKQNLIAMRQRQRARLQNGPVPINEAMDQLLRSGALTQPWQNPATQPFQRPPAESIPSVRNRT
jgi:hypothetical protein